MNPIGSENDLYLENAIKSADKIIVAWGNHGVLEHRYKVVLNMLAVAGVQSYCLGTTKTGHPRHPLYIKTDTHPVKY